MRWAALVDWFRTGDPKKYLDYFSQPLGSIYDMVPEGDLIAATGFIGNRWFCAFVTNGVNKERQKRYVDDREDRDFHFLMYNQDLSVCGRKEFGPRHLYLNPPEKVYLAKITDMEEITTRRITEDYWVRPKTGPDFGFNEENLYRVDAKRGGIIIVQNLAGKIQETFRDPSKERDEGEARKLYCYNRLF